MTLSVISLSHHRVHLAVREKLVWNDHASCDMFTALSAQQPNKTVGIVPFATCNRSEIYLSGAPDLVDTTLNWLSQHSGVDKNQLMQWAFIGKNKAVLRHAMRVACGLESMMLGEDQVLGQMKRAYRQAYQQQHVDQALSAMFEYALIQARKIRQQTSIDCHPTSLAYASVRFARQIFGDLSTRTALIIGSGENARNVAHCLKGEGIKDIRIANRTREHAQTMAEHFNGIVVSLDTLASQLDTIDIIVSSTASPQWMVSRAMLEHALQKRKHRPIFIVDLALPRDIEPDARELEDIYLYAIDDLHHVLDDSLAQRQQAAREVERLIEYSLMRSEDVENDLHANAAVRDYRARVEQIRAHTLAMVQREMTRGLPAEKALSLLAHQLSNRLAHAPTTALRQLNAANSPQFSVWLKDILLHPVRENL